MMQYVRLYINDLGVIEHVETSDHPLKETHGISVNELSRLPIPGETPEDIALIPMRVQPLDIVTCEFEHADGKFHRAREVLNDIEVDQTTLEPRLKTDGQLRGRLQRKTIERADRGGR